MEQPNDKYRKGPVKDFDLSKISIHENYIDMSSLYDARNRAIKEMEIIGKDYSAWGEGAHRRLQIAADNVMLVNIIEDLFHYGNKRGSRS